PGAVLPLEADPGLARQALLAAIRGEQLRPTPPRAEPEPDHAQALSAGAEPPPAALGLLALASGHGSPGRTTMAVSLAAALGAVAPTVLVDADVFGPSVAAHLDL